MTEAWKSIGTNIFEAKDDSTDADIKKLCDGIIATKKLLEKAIETYPFAQGSKNKLKSLE